MSLLSVTRGTTQLADGLLAGAVVERLIVGGEVLIQEAEYLRGTALRIFDRGNFRTPITLTIWQQHGSKLAAQRHRVRHPRESTGKADLRLVFTEGSDTLTMLLADAGWRRTDVELTGISTRTTYSIIGGNFVIPGELLTEGGFGILSEDGNPILTEE